MAQVRVRWPDITFAARVRALEGDSPATFNYFAVRDGRILVLDRRRGGLTAKHYADPDMVRAAAKRRKLI